MNSVIIFVCNDSVSIDIFNASEDIFLDLWVYFFQFSDEIFDFETL